MFNWKKWLLFVGLVFIATCLLVYIVTYIIKNYFGLSSSDTLAMAQLVLSLLLLPTVLVGFFITVQAFRESQALPDLDLFLETKSGVHEKRLRFSSSDILKRRKESEGRSIHESELPIALVIKNKGNAIALWYAVTITIQLGTVPKSAYLDWTQFYKTGGEHWQINHAEREKSKRFEALFMSKGTLAAYPNLPIKLCEMNTGWFFEEQSSKKEYHIFYTIVADRAHKKQGSLHLIF